MSQYKKIKVLENTTYGLLLSFLLLDKKNNDIEWILVDNFNNHIINNMIRNNYKCQKSTYGILKKEKFIYYIKLIKNFFTKENITVYGNDHLDISIPYRKYGFNLIEDGLLNYTYFQTGYIKRTIKEEIKRIIKFIPSDKKCYGLDKRVKKIYLTGLGPIPNEIAHKVEIINLKELWNKKTKEEQDEILDIFSFDLNIKDVLKGKEIILFTQPLFEDGIISEEEKIEIYRKIISKYSSNNLVIKTHPREKTNYKEIFKEYLILDNPFPFEILNLLDIKFKKSVTVFSTAALSLGDDVKVDFYGTEIHPNILKQFGSYKKIHETTAKI